MVTVMKKKYLTIFILLLSVSIHSQKQTKEERQDILDEKKRVKNEKDQKPMDYKSVPEDFCKVDHKCKLQYKYDEFDNYYLYKIPFYSTQNIVKGAFNLQSNYSLMKVKDNKGNEFILMTFWGFPAQCITEDSYVGLIFSDDEVVKLPTFYKSIDCGARTITVDITNHIEDLIYKDIRKIRFRIESNTDYEFSNNIKVLERLNKNLKCISSI